MKLPAEREIGRKARGRQDARESVSVGANAAEEHLVVSGQGVVEVGIGDMGLDKSVPCEGV